MVQRLSLCTTTLLVALLLAPASSLAIMPPRPDSGARPPVLPPAVRQAGFGMPGRADLVKPSLGFSGLASADGKSLPVSSLRLPVLLGDTSDQPGSQDPSTLRAELFGQWSTGSLSAYFDEVSYGTFDVGGEVFGWHRLSHAMSYYQQENWPAGVGAFVTEVVERADEAGIDWGLYDNDGPDGVPNSGDDDGYVDTAVIVHSGAGGECGGNGFIWSHTFFLRGWGAPVCTTSTPAAGGGYIKVDDYTIQPELSCDGGLIEIGVFCHELGHALGLPDLYDTREDAGSGVGYWGLMGNGSWGGDGQSPWRPVHPVAWSRIALGWVTPTIIECDDAVELAAVELVPSILKIWSDGRPQNEYFLVENRYRCLSDSALPTSGLCVWHIDEDEVADGLVYNTVNSRPIYGVALEQADGYDQLGVGTNLGDAADLFPGLNQLTSFSNATSPSSRANSGAATQVGLASISKAGETMTFTVDVGVAELDVEAPVVSVLDPVGGGEWNTGSLQSINWAAVDNVGVVGVSIMLSRDAGYSFSETLASGLANSGVWRWQVPNETGVDYMIKVVAADQRGNLGFDLSDGVFSLVDPWPPGVVVYAPSVDELWVAGSTKTVTWNAADNIAVVAIDIHLSLDSGVTWPVTLARDLPNDGAWNWQVASYTTDEAVIQVVARDAAGLSADEQSPVFRLTGTSAVEDLPETLSLGPIAPNPFNPVTMIHFENGQAGRVRIEVFDLAGRRVRVLVDELRPAGPGSVRWHGNDAGGRAVASGIYYVRAHCAGETRMLKAALLR